MTESYGVLTVGSVTSGTIAVGQQVTGAGVASLTGIEDNLSGSGAGSTWVVNNAQTVAPESMTMKATPLAVTYNSIVGATANRAYFEVQPNGNFGFDYNPGALSYVGGTAVDALGLSQASGALNSTSSGFPTSAAAYMNNLIQNETSQFGSFQATGTQLAGVDPAYLGDLAAWAQSSNGLYPFLGQSTTATPPAGSSLPTSDPAGTYSGPGASAPTTDLPGSYSLAGASAPTLAQPGYYVPTAGASSETPVDPGYYTPYAGATAEILALPPVISGTAGGQSTASGQPDAPFASVTISDPNIATTDSLSIQVTGGGGVLADGAGFSGLTSSAPGVYLLSGTASAITSELEALVFTPGAGSGTTTLTLTDTTSVGTSASDANTTVTVLSAGPPVVSVAYFLANQSTPDQTAGGFDIADTAANITANLDALNADPNIGSIALTDGGTLTLTLSIEEALNDTRALSEIASPHTTALADTAADIQLITSAQASTLQADGYTSIAATTGPVAMTIAEATYLSGDGIAVTGAPVVVSGTVAAMAAITTTEAATLSGQGYALAVLDTAADIRAMTVTQINALAARQVLQINASDTTVSLMVAQITSLEAGAMKVSAPVSDDTVVISDTAAQLETLTASQIDGLPSIGVTGLVSTNANVSYSSTQTAALLASGLNVSASGTRRAIDYVDGRAPIVSRRLFPRKPPITQFQKWAIDADRKKLIRMIQLLSAQGGRWVNGRSRGAGKRSDARWEPEIMGENRGAGTRDHRGGAPANCAELELIGFLAFDWQRASGNRPKPGRSDKTGFGDLMHSVFQWLCLPEAAAT
jgi:hypothetical protein